MSEENLSNINSIIDIYPNKSIVEENNNNKEFINIGNNNKSNKEIIHNKNMKNNDDVNNSISNKRELITSIDDKYKNLENPFDNPEIIKNEEDEKRKRKIMDRINKGRKNVQSHSVDNAKYKKSEKIQEMADNLENHLIKDDNK